MSGMENGVNTVTLRVNRFAPRAERARDRERGGSPFARKSSPFGDSGTSARRRPRGKQWLHVRSIAFFFCRMWNCGQPVLQK